MLGNILIVIYRFWHGKLKLPGSGRLISKSAPHVSTLWKYPIVLSENHMIHVDFRDISAFYWINHLLGDGFEEAGLLKAILRHIGVGDVFWDIGSNCGLLSYCILKVEPTTEIHAFEPNPMMFLLTKEALAPRANCRVHNYGISNVEAELTLTVPFGQTTLGTLEPELTSRSGALVQIMCRRGDDLTEKYGISPPSIIKIDTEGHELQVMGSLYGTIQKYLPMVIFEHISLSDEQVYSLVPDGYVLSTIEEVTGKLLPGLHRDNGHNSVLIHWATQAGK